MLINYMQNNIMLLLHEISSKIVGQPKVWFGQVKFVIYLPEGQLTLKVNVKP